MSAERDDRRDGDPTDLVELLDRYKAELAKLNGLRRGSPEYDAEWKIEEALAREIRIWCATNGRGVSD